MKRQIQNLIVIASIFCLPALGSHALAEEVRQFWKMQTVPHVGLSEIFIIKIDGSIAQIYDINNNKIAEGTISKNLIKARSTDLSATYDINATIFGASMSGTTTIIEKNKDIQWKATRVGGIYKCGNHNPAHTATTLEEMQRLTKENQCRGWSRVR